MTRDPSIRDPWDDAMLAAACIAVDPVGLGGVRVRSSAGPVRDAWIARWRALLATSTPVRPVPLHVDAGRLSGGLDLAASLRSGRAVQEPGLLAEADGGYTLLSMAERIDPSTAAQIAAALETGRTRLGTATRFGVVALDESDGDELVSDTLAERLGLAIDLHRCGTAALAAVPPYHARTIESARARVASVTTSDAVVSALCETAVTLGITSLRVPRFALVAARAIAALEGRDVAEEADAARAARLVFALRVRRLPQDENTSQDANDAEEPSFGPSQNSSREDPGDDSTTPGAADSLEDIVLDATLVAIPSGLLARLARDAAFRQTGSAKSGAGATGRGRQRGAPAGVRRARPRAPERLALIETLRAAAPWQRMRHAESPRERRGVQVRAEDLHVVRFKQRRAATTVFVVDASGSSALHRLAEAKGAVESLLADCYVRRDEVAVLAFRGKTTEMLLPPTRSLVRARRSLAALPGGGGTPLASALDATREWVVTLRRRGDTVLVVLLTDGRANVARDGSGGRPAAEADALASARSLAALRAEVLLIDTSPQPHPMAARLADAMGALYRPLPHAGAGTLSAAVRDVARGPLAGRG